MQVKWLKLQEMSGGALRRHSFLGAGFYPKKIAGNGNVK
jgi:hypothetical protein